MVKWSVDYLQDSGQWATIAQSLCLSGCKDMARHYLHTRTGMEMKEKKVRSFRIYNPKGRLVTFSDCQWYKHIVWVKGNRKTREQQGELS